MIDSPWSVWWHPRRAYGELAAVREEADALRAELEALQREKTDLLAGLKESRDVQDDFERVRVSLETEVAELKRVNSEQADRLKDWETASAEMERVAGQLEKMVAMRDRMNAMRLDYEAKIAKLERQLWSSRSGGLKYARPEQELPDPSESELFDPGEGPASPPVPIQLTPRRPKINPPADDSDWLLSLPD